MYKNFINQLKWRGMIHDQIPGTEEYLMSQRVCGYIGFDSTAPSLHIGSLATIMLLKHLQLSGHQPIVLLGGATTMVGDPSWRSSDRQPITEAILRYNQRCIHQQLSQFLDFSEELSNRAILLNNYDWLGNIGLLSFLCEAGKYITVPYMLAKESVKQRLESGLSFAEFSYQLLQGYDFYHLYTQYNVTLQMGGADQWGNITSGVELVRRKTGCEVFALTTSLITKSDGCKFGKTEEGNIWLDPKLTSPYKFYQFWLNTTDLDAERYIKIFTLLEEFELNELIAQHHKAPHNRLLQSRLAREVTGFIHTPEVCAQVQRVTQLLFGMVTDKMKLEQLEQADFDLICSELPCFNISKIEFGKIENVLEILIHAEIFDSQNEAKRMISQGGVYLNGDRVMDSKQALPSLLHGRYVFVQKGKKNYHVISVDD